MRRQKRLEWSVSADIRFNMETHLSSQLDGSRLRSAVVFCWTARRPALRVGLSAAACCLMFAQSALGQYNYQYNPRARTPSQQSVAGLYGVGRSFGTDAGLLGEGRMGRSTASRFGGMATTLGSQSTLSRLGGARNWRDTRLFSGGGGDDYRRGSLLGGPSLGGGLAGFRGLGGGYGGRSALARSYQNVLRGDWSIGVPPINGDSRLFGDRESMLQIVGGYPAQGLEGILPPTTRPSGAPEDQTRMQDLLVVQLRGQRELHQEAGWEAFKAGKYQKACGEFSLAEGYASIDQADKLESRLPSFYALIAIQQWAEATGGLQWMLKEYSGADAETQKRFAAAIPELPARYGQASDLGKHLQAVGEYVAMRENAVRLAYNSTASKDEQGRLWMAMKEAQALQVMMWYAIPEQRSRAISEAQAFAPSVFAAQSFATQREPWIALAKLIADEELQQDKKADGPVARPASPAADFPFNIYNKEAQAPAGPTLPPVSP